MTIELDRFSDSEFNGLSVYSWGFAMSEQAELSGEALGQFREYLLMLARLQVRDQLRAKFDPSDIVQQTLLDAYRQRAQYRGQTKAEMAAWLRQMLACNLADAVRAFGRAKRNAVRERSLEARLDESSERLGTCLAAELSTPSEQVQRCEQAVRLANALAALPDGQREALVLRHYEGQSLADVSRNLGRSPDAVAGLLKRGLKELRKQLSESG
jgi:RNA polymerase sigma-70 factor (ECF subfamily)